MTIVNPGYIGIVSILASNGSLATMRCTDISMSPDQDVKFYDHVIGLNDTIPSDNSTKGESVGNIQIQKTVWRPGVLSYVGGVSFPVTVSGENAECENTVCSLQTVFDLAKYGNYFTLTAIYNCKVTRTFSNCRINSFSLNITAGDIVTATINVVAMSVIETDTTTANPFTITEKIATWDIVSLVNNGSSISLDDAQAFSLDINNNIKTIYTQDSLAPYDLRVGMQAVTGSITLYNAHGDLELPDGETTLQLDIGDVFSTTINCVLQPSSIPGSIKSIMSIIPFAGVDKVFGA